MPATYASSKEKILLILTRCRSPDPDRVLRGWLWWLYLRGRLKKLGDATWACFLDLSTRIPSSYRSPTPDFAWPHQVRIAIPEVVETLRKHQLSLESLMELAVISACLERMAHSCGQHDAEQLLRGLSASIGFVSADAGRARHK